MSRKKKVEVPPAGGGFHWREIGIGEAVLQDHETGDMIGSVSRLCFGPKWSIATYRKRVLGVDFPDMAAAKRAVEQAHGESHI